MVPWVPRDPPGRGETPDLRVHQVTPVIPGVRDPMDPPGHLGLGDPKDREGIQALRDLVVPQDHVEKRVEGGTRDTLDRLGSTVLRDEVVPLDRKDPSELRDRVGTLDHRGHRDVRVEEETQVLLVIVDLPGILDPKVRPDREDLLGDKDPVDNQERGENQVLGVLVEGTGPVETQDPSDQRVRDLPDPQDHRDRQERGETVDL